METIDINLLPGRKRKKRLSKEDKQIITIGLLVFFFLIAMYGGVLYIKQQKEVKLNELNTRINSLRSVQDILNKRNALGDKLLYYENSIKNYTLKQTDWNALISKIASVLPKETTLNQIMADKKSMQITISGKTKDLQTLAWTVYAFQNEKDFSSVILQSYDVPYGGKAQQGQKNPKTTFTITFKWKGMKK